MGMEISKTELETMMKQVAQGAIDGSVKTRLDELSQKHAEFEKKLVFPVQEGPMEDGFLKTLDGSVLNTASFVKTFRNGAKMSMDDFGKSVIGSGGLFQKLSPAMEQFAKLLKGKLDANRLSNLGFDAPGYKSLCIEQRKQTGMNEGVGADGGFLVPVEYSATMIEFAIIMSQILNRVWRVPMKSNQAKWPRLAQTDDSFFGGFQIHWIDEGAAKPTEKLALEQLTFNAHKAAKIIPLTDELIEDSLINIVNYCVALGTRAYMYELEHCVIDGTGIGQPLGIINDPVVVANAVARVGAGAVDYRDLLNLEGEMNENFRNLEWIMRRKVLTEIRKLRDTVGQPIWHETWASFNETPTMTPTILSYPYHITRNANAIGHQGDIVLGDLGFYMLAVRKDMTIDVSPYPYWTTDETAIRFVARVDGKPGSSYAFKILSGTGS
jgi:HK97 family phage major capsid protein